MPNDAGRRFVADANESMERNLTRNESTILASYRLIGALLFLGGAGYLLDRWLETAPWLLLLGLTVGVGVGFVGLYRLVRRP
jgi:F0F1-type ATP synthase assembly protein I